MTDGTTTATNVPEPRRPTGCVSSAPATRSRATVSPDGVTWTTGRTRRTTVDGLERLHRARGHEPQRTACSARAVSTTSRRPATDAGTSRPEGPPSTAPSSAAGSWVSRSRASSSGGGRICGSRSWRRKPRSRRTSPGTTAASSTPASTTSPALSRRASASRGESASCDSATHMRSPTGSTANSSSRSRSATCAPRRRFSSGAAPTASPGSRRSGRKGSGEREPHATGLAAIWVPSTGVVDYRKVAARSRRRRAEAGRRSRPRSEGRRGFGAPRTRRSSRRPPETFRAARRHRLRRATVRPARRGRAGGATSSASFPSEATTTSCAPEARHLSRSMINPVPDPRFPFLGVHFTRRIDGEVLAGPNAVLALAREGYGRFRVNLADDWRTFSWPGFWRFASRHWEPVLPRCGATTSRRRTCAVSRPSCPEIRSEDLLPGPCGIRAQAVDRAGGLVDDFVIRAEGDVTHVLNAPSPAATSSLAIAREIVDRIEGPAPGRQERRGGTPGIARSEGASRSPRPRAPPRSRGATGGQANPSRDLFRASIRAQEARGPGPEGDRKARERDREAVAPRLDVRLLPRPAAEERRDPVGGAGPSQGLDLLRRKEAPRDVVARPGGVDSRRPPRPRARTRRRAGPNRRNARG